MSERRFKEAVTDLLSESLPDPSSGSLERWLAPTTESRIEQIPVDEVHDRAWRAEVDTTDPAYRALKASIRASGVLQPLLLRPRAEGGYEVVSGARRLRAARETAQSTVPAVVRELSDVQALVGGSWDAVLRSGLSPTEGSRLVADLVAAGMEEGRARALVATAPVREEPGGAGAVAVAVDVSVAEPPAGGVDVSAGEAGGDAASAEAPPAKPRRRRTTTRRRAAEAPAAEAPSDEAPAAAEVPAAAEATAAASEAPTAAVRELPTEAPPATVGEAVVSAPPDADVEAAAEPSVDAAAEVATDEAAPTAGATAEAASPTAQLETAEPPLDAEAEVAAFEPSVGAAAEVATDEAASVASESADSALPAADLETAAETSVDATAEVPTDEAAPIPQEPTDTAEPDSAAEPTAAAPDAPTEQAVPATGDTAAPAAGAGEVETAAEVAADAAPAGSSVEDALADLLEPGAEEQAAAPPLEDTAPAVVDEQPVAATNGTVDAALDAEPAGEQTLDLDDEVAGWPTSDTDTAATAAPSPPAPVPVDPVHFPLPPRSSEAAPASPVVAEPSSTATHPVDTADTEQTAEAEKVDDAVVVRTDERSAVGGVTPHVIPIRLPEAADALAADEESDSEGSMPVAAPAALAEPEPDGGSRLVQAPATPVRTAPAAPRPAASALVDVFRRGPVFYAVLAIGLAVGAIVFIVTSIAEGVVSGTTPIIVAVVIAVIGLVAAMVCVAQPRQRR